MTKTSAICIVLAALTIAAVCPVMAQDQNITGEYKINAARAVARPAANASSIFAGAYAGGSSTGANMVCVGDYAGYSTTTNPDYLVAVGKSAGRANTGATSTMVGSSSGWSNTGSALSSFGYGAGQNNTGSNVLAMGRYAGYTNTGGFTTCIGAFSGYTNTGQNGIFLGYYAGYQNTGDALTAIGYNAGYKNAGINNLFVGSLSGSENAAGADGLVGLGARALRLNTAPRVIAIGMDAGQSNAQADCVLIGYQAVAKAPRQAVIGSPTSYLTDFYLGGGVEMSAPNNVTLHATNATGSAKGADLILKGGTSVSGTAGIVKADSNLEVNGDAKVKVLEITGGSDLSEMFNVRTPQAANDAASLLLSKGAKR